MGDEPTHDFDERRRRFFDAVGNSERVDEIRSLLADDYIHVDRRRMIGLPDLDVAGLIESFRIGHEAGLESVDAQLVATRGHRLGLNQVTTRFRDGSEKQYLMLSKWDRTATKVELTVRFDADDLDVAMAELDHLHAEVEANHE